MWLGSKNLQWSFPIIIAFFLSPSDSTSLAGDVKVAVQESHKEVSLYSTVACCNIGRSSIFFLTVPLLKYQLLKEASLQWVTVLSREVTGGQYENKKKIPKILIRFKAIMQRHYTHIFQDTVAMEVK